ncbi:MAG: discoidin domain-containing protein, partial [Bacteroides uniformis]|nr:discoidin domain-containing protein [Bacteroides uniformis]
KPDMAYKYKFSVSLDGKSWKEVPTHGEFSNIMHNPLPQTVALPAGCQARFVRLDATSPDNQPAKVAMEEIGFLSAAE